MQRFGYGGNGHCGTASSVAHDHLSTACVNSSEQLSLFASRTGFVVDGE
jgi:hypothetical protein